MLQAIKNGETVRKEPSYIQKALGTRDNDIGNTYVEINLTNQCLWFYKDGKIIVQGDVVTGNISKGNATPQGTYTLNYKQKDATYKFLVELHCPYLYYLLQHPLELLSSHPYRTISID